ncbi:MAG: winged helix-turn-helix transcriptional regulator [Chloroflexi bacterium]|nr:winged helix-turn-helix transcriptional regulator [Chloroflexota bacterium]
MTEKQLRAIIATGESTTVEFKSDRGPLSDADLLETVVCLANGQGGTILIGVEDDGTVTGLHPDHRTRPGFLAAFVTSRTVPSLAVEVAFVDLPEGPVAVVTVPAAHQPVATSDGKLVIRYTDTHGRPGCRPLYPYELTSWRADRGLTDLSALPVPGTTWDDLDPLEFARLRRMVEENRGDAALLELSDQAIARALGLVRAEDNVLTPTLAGLLLVGKESALREYLPAHEVAFQVLRGTDVAVNEFRRWPLLRVHEWLVQAIEVRNEEQELMVGSFRVGVPRYDRRGIREAVNNALIHRDYTRLGAIHVQLHDNHALVTNPGGFVLGVRVDNLLVAAPRPRNPLLADAFKRVGLVERTGRGVGIIYHGQLSNGRPPPSYDRSTETNVTVTLDSRPADLDFVQLTIQANRKLEHALGVEELLALWEVWRKGTTNIHELMPILQRDVTNTADVLAELAQAGLLKADGPAYRLAPELRAGAERRVGIIPIDPDAAILSYVQECGRITRREAMTLTGLSEEQTRYRVRKLVERGALEQVGIGRGAHYRMAQKEKNGE